MTRHDFGGNGLDRSSKLNGMNQNETLTFYRAEIAPNSTWTVLICSTL